MGMPDTSLIAVLKRTSCIVTIQHNSAVVGNFADCRGLRMSLRQGKTSATDYKQQRDTRQVAVHGTLLDVLEPHRHFTNPFKPYRTAALTKQDASLSH